MSKPLVSIVMGSDSDLEIMREAGKALDEFGIAYEIDVTSAHRSPDRTAEFARKAADRGIRVIIAGAGGAAHLAGVIAAHTTLAGDWRARFRRLRCNGMDSLLATVQMPAGIPGGNRRDRQAGRDQRGHSRRPDDRSVATRQLPRNLMRIRRSWPAAWKRNRRS